MWRATFTELIATTFLVFTLTISIISCLESSNESEKPNKILVPFAVFIIAFFFLLATIPLSGGHMNPIFTIIAALKGFTSLLRAVFYITAQCLGSIISYTIIKSVMDANTAQKYSLGGCEINDRNGTGITLETALVLEFCCTFLVLFVGVTVAFDKRRFKELGLVMICVVLAATMGLAVFVSITVTGKSGYGGVGLNPARCLGSALVHGGSLWYGHWVFWVGPFLACIVYYGFTLTLPKEGME
ncbi:probable aquaporin PIP2-6 [Mercurialis annua]|uniref:probable aquaporin PIP2-6 n=1 Tax=Mercurialis annua TaxID=3986 RepID=UPI002160FED5|nr:probable aquaporin PIP2-6 [Mercurialis annua]